MLNVVMFLYLGSIGAGIVYLSHVALRTIKENEKYDAEKKARKKAKKEKKRLKALAAG